MRSPLTYYSKKHPINKFIAVVSNEVITVKAIEIYDCELEDCIAINDPELISAYCYCQLNVFDEYSFEGFHEAVKNKNENWEVENIILAKYTMH